jgi:threonylcarbamoyladenosine tRNA methylthiotransferase MtaB
MPQVAGAAVKERAARLRRKGRMALAGYLEAQVGREVDVLVEQPGLGRTASFAEVEVAADLAAAGALVSLRVTRSDGARLRGEPDTPKCAP